MFQTNACLALVTEVVSEADSRGDVVTSPAELPAVTGAWAGFKRQPRPFHLVKCGCSLRERPPRLVV